MKIVLYARVSTGNQTVSQQLDELRRTCTRQGCEIVAELQDVVSGTKFTRQGLDQLMGMVRGKKIDLVAVHKLDRLGRSLPHLAQLIGEFEANGVALLVPGQGIDTRNANPAGKLQLHILMAVAEFERSLISERTRLKLQALKKAGRHIGRPKMKIRVPPKAFALFEEIHKRTGKIPTCRAMAEGLDVSVGTGHRLQKEITQVLGISARFQSREDLRASQPIDLP